MKRFDIKIPCREIMKSIATWSYTIGELMSDEQMKLRHTVQGATDFGHASLIKEALDMAWVEMLDALSAYTVAHGCCCDREGCDCGESVHNDSVEYELCGDTIDMHDYNVSLQFPDDIYPQMGYKIAVTVKQYMLMKCRAQWETLVGRDPTASEVAAQSARSRLKVTINTRIPIGHTNDEYSNYLKF